MRGVALGDFFKEVGHPNLFRATAQIDRNFNGSTDVIGVHMTVPDAIATDDNN